MDIKLYDVAKAIQRADQNGKVTKNSESVTEGLTPVPFDITTGYRIAPPEELASLVIPVAEYSEKNLSLDGFQRILQVPHARRIARALESDAEMPPILVSVDENGEPLATDGQHRAIGAIIARRPLRVVVERRNRAHAQQLFANQKKAATVTNDVLILSGGGPYNEYIQDALTDANHPWHNLVGPGSVGGKGASNSLSPYSMKILLIAYVGNQAGVKGKTTADDDPMIVKRWDTAVADQFAELISCFGTKKTRPEAFTSKSIRAVGSTATLVIRRNGMRQSDIERWKRHMPQFNFAAYQHLSYSDLANMLLAHWNKKLKNENRISRPRS